MRQLTAKFLLASGALILSAGCRSDSEQQSEPVAEKTSKKFHITDYGSSDPALEPTLRLGGKFEVRTADGSPVVIQSQQDQQRRAAEEQRRAQQAAATTVETVQPDPTSK